jgi:hypothetical protein
MIPSLDNYPQKNEAQTNRNITKKRDDGRDKEGTIGQDCEDTQAEVMKGS